MKINLHSCDTWDRTRAVQPVAKPIKKIPVDIIIVEVQAYLACATILARMMSAVVQFALTVGTIVPWRTTTGVGTLAGVEARPSVPAGLVVRAVV